MRICRRGHAHALHRVLPLAPLGLASRSRLVDEHSDVLRRGGAAGTAFSVSARETFADSCVWSALIVGFEKALPLFGICLCGPAPAAESQSSTSAFRQSGGKHAPYRPCSGGDKNRGNPFPSLLAAWRLAPLAESKFLACSWLDEVREICRFQKQISSFQLLGLLDKPEEKKK